MEHVNTKYPNLPSNFGAEVRKARLRCGLTLKQVGEDLGLNHVFISQLERGVRNFNPEMAVKFRDYFEMDYDLPEPRPEEAQIRRYRRKLELEHDRFIICVEGELIEVVSYRRLGKLTEATIQEGSIHGSA